jgi:hypothetical protein
MAWSIGTRLARTLAAPVVFSIVLIPSASSVVFFSLVSTASAGERYAVVVTGASGGDQYAQKYSRLRAMITTTLRDTFGYKSDRVIALGEDEGQGVLKATRENVRRVFGDLRRQLTKDDQLLVLLIGHGTTADGGDGSGGEGKFNLVGPDLTAGEWSDLLKPLPGRLVFVDTSGASFPFLHTLAGRGRIVLTATDSVAQQFETVFPEYFIKAFDDEAADVDKSGRVSIWEAFVYASAAVRQFFEKKGDLPTERALLDDTGAGIGREAQAPGADGALARVTYLEPEPALELPSDAGLAVLVKRRAALEAALEELKARRESLPQDQYAAELERILTELARVSLQLKTKS